MHLGNALQRQREAARLSQRDLAERMNTSQGSVSRLETNPTPDDSDAVAYLRAVGSDAARELLAYMEAKWTHVDKVDFDHPDREALSSAEDALRILHKIKREQDVAGPLSEELNLYEDALAKAVEYLASTRHTVSFIGAIGVGKTSALCSLTGLTAAGKPVLSHGAGRTTLCEVRILEGPEYGLIVEPLPPHEVTQIVEDFCEFIWARANGVQNDEDTTLDLSVELKRCIRNMTGLVQKRDRETKSVQDLAVDLARESESKSALKRSIISLLNINERTYREAWYQGERGGEHEWLSKIFGDINHGKTSTFSIPKSIRVILPRPLLKPSTEPTPYTISIVDTKGLDDLAPRSDVKEYLDDDRTVSILCSRFESAPDGRVHALMAFACDIGIKEKLSRDAMLLLLERDGEAVQVNDFDGNPVESREDGQEVKRAEVEDQLSNDPLNLTDFDIRIFDQRLDDPQSTQDAILEHIRRMRKRYSTRISQMKERLIARQGNVDRLKEEAAINEVIKDVQAWLEEAKEQDLSVSALQSRLPAIIGQIHTSSIRAAVNRRGSWLNLDYYAQIAFGARTDATTCYKQSIDRLRAILDVKLGRPDLRPAETFVREIASLLERREQLLLERSEIAALASYEAPLRDDDPLWSQSRQRWGQGPGYRDDVSELTADWLRSSRHEHLAEEVKNGLQREWEALLGDIEVAVQGPNGSDTTHSSRA